MEYSTGIFSIASVQGAPGIKAVEGLFEIYNPQYKLELISIPNEKAIETFYMGEEPQVSQIQIEVPLPNPETLEHLFGWKEDEYLRVMSDRNLQLNVTLKGEPRTSILSGKSESQNIVRVISSNISKYRKAKIRGKIENKKTQDYNFFEENFSYPIDIADHHVQGYERIYYTADELVELYKQNLVMAYRENENILKEIIGR